MHSIKISPREKIRGEVRKMAACVCFCGADLIPALPNGVLRPGRYSPGNHWHLCVLSVTEAQHLARYPLFCRTLLVPEGTYQPLWQAEQVVSYGLSGRSSLTLSSMGQRDMLCVQRALTDRQGQTVEEQELSLPAAWNVFSPSDRLLLAGTWLLWNGVLPPD